MARVKLAGNFIFLKLAGHVVFAERGARRNSSLEEAHHHHPLRLSRAGLHGQGMV